MTATVEGQCVEPGELDVLPADILRRTSSENIFTLNDWKSYAELCKISFSPS